MEGTNLGSDKSCVAESDLEDEFVELFQSTAGRVFVAWSAQNVDRTVTLYRACLKTGRTLAVDLYTAEVMEALADSGKLPRPAGRIWRSSSPARLRECIDRPVGKPLSSGWFRTVSPRLNSR
jgi:mRNA degradation ribonuclease J1/J2